MKKILAYTLLSIILLVPLYGQYSYMPGDREVEMLLDSYSAAGRIFPHSGFPLSKKDLYQYALELGNEDVLDIIDYDPDSVVFEESIEINYEQYFRSSEAWPDFTRLYLKTPDFLNITLNAQDDDLGGIYLKAGLKTEYDEDDLFKSNNFFPNYDGNPIAAENGMIRAGYFYYLLDSLDFVIGRNKVHYGAADFSTLYPSKDIPFLDGVFYKFNLGSLQMQSYFATLENRQADVDLMNGSGEVPKSAVFGENTIIATMHRFEYSWSKVRFGVGAHSFVVRAENGFQLGDIFPVFSWHNTVVGEHNMSLVMDLSVVPYPGLELYFMGGTDDISASDLVGINDSELPTIPSWIVGAAYQPLFTEILSKVTFEAGKTHYLWGNFLLG